jgi:RHS repeat-associated protein
MNALGNLRSTSAVGNRFMFQGREYFPELGIYDYRHRMYDPLLGRFLQTDPTGFGAGDMNLFRYCGDDPVDRSDPTGEYFSFSQVGNDVNLYLPMMYIGGTPNTIARLNAGITRAWTGQFGAYHVTMHVYSPSNGAPANVIALNSGAGVSKTTANADGGIWFLTQQYDNIEGMAAHEAGHLMLLYYGVDGNSTDRSNIMGSIFGRVSETNIRYILNLNRSTEIVGPTRQPPATAFPNGLTLFGHRHGGPALFNNGGGWQPIGKAASDVRWARNSGTGNWIASQTTNGYLLGGGENYGEGFHPVAWNRR